MLLIQTKRNAITKIVPLLGMSLSKKTLSKEYYKERIFNLSFKYRWFTNHPSYVYSKELSGGLCKSCVLFEKSTKYQGIFVKNVFPDVTKTEKITEYAGLHHHLAVIIKSEHFVKGCKHPTTNVGCDKDKKRGTKKLSKMQCFPQDTEILGWCPAGPVLPYGEVPL